MATRKPGSSHPSTKKRTSSSPRSSSRRGGKTIKAAIDDFLLDRQSQNHSPQTLRWHTIALDHFVTFLEKQHTRIALREIVPAGRISPLFSPCTRSPHHRRPLHSYAFLATGKDGSSLFDGYDFS